MKRFSFWGGLLIICALFLMMSGQGAFAAEKIGVIDPQKVLSQHPKFQQVQSQIKAMVQQKKQEAQKAIDKEKDNRKKAQIFEAKQLEAEQAQQKLMAPLISDINKSIRDVAKANGITIVLNKNLVFYGGTDITNSVIKKLKSK